MDGYRPESKQTIGNKCRGTVPGGRCNFIEFINNIDSMNLFAKETEDGREERITRLNMNSIPATLNRLDPDPAQAAELGEWEGRLNLKDGTKFKNYEGSYSALKLLGVDYKINWATLENFRRWVRFVLISNHGTTVI
jgi:hypothetical protein